MSKKSVDDNTIRCFFLPDSISESRCIRDWQGSPVSASTAISVFVVVLPNLSSSGQTLPKRWHSLPFTLSVPKYRHFSLSKTDSCLVTDVLRQFALRYLLRDLVRFFGRSALPRHDCFCSKVVVKWGRFGRVSGLPALHPVHYISNRVRKIAESPENQEHRSVFSGFDIAMFSRKTQHISEKPCILTAR